MSLELLTRRINRLGADSAAQPKRPRGSGVAARQLVAVSGLVCVSAGVVFLNPVLVLCGLVMTTTGLSMRALSWDLALPASVIALLATSTTVGVAAGLLDVDLLSRPWPLACAYVGYAVAGTYWAWRPAAPLLTRSAPKGGYGWVAYSSATIAASIGLAQSFSERIAASWALAGTDLAQHMILVQAVQRSGSLDYSLNGYPQGFHMLAAFVSVPGAPLDHPAQLLSYDLRLVSSTTWLSLALVLWTGITLALRLAAARGVPRGVAVGAAVLFGAGALLTNTFVVTFVYAGAAASLLAVVVILALPLASLGLTARRRRLMLLPVLAATCVMLLAHLWQPLIAVPALAFAAYAAPGFRVVWSALRRRPSQELGRQVALVMGATLVLFAVGSVPVLRAQTGGGISQASTAGDVTAVPWRVLLLALVVAAWFFRDFRRGWTRMYVGSISGLLLAVGVMLRGANHGFDLNQYYPMKVLWFLLLVLGPILALVSVGVGWRLLRPVWRWLARLGGLTKVCRFALVACLCALAFAFWLPRMLGTGSTTEKAVERHSSAIGKNDMSTIGGVSSERFDIAGQFGSRYSPAVTVPVAVGLTAGFDHFGPYIVSKLISFQTGQPQTRGGADEVCSDVALATGGSADAVVITQMDPVALRAIMTKQGCAEVPVVKIPGGGQVGQFTVDLG